jgi:hypothetical protein
MRLNKWSATIAMVTLLLSGGSLADLAKPQTATKTDPKRCERSECDCSLTGIDEDALED